jgi:hypothetical protein
MLGLVEEGGEEELAFFLGKGEVTSQSCSAEARSPKRPRFP